LFSHWDDNPSQHPINTCILLSESHFLQIYW
jgi:hypothetical protein